MRIMCQPKPRQIKKHETSQKAYQRQPSHVRGRFGFLGACEKLNEKIH